MQVAYQGDCSCRLKSGFACHPFNRPGASPCVATWWSSLGKCKAVAVLNVGAETAPDVEVTFDQINASSERHSITSVYEKKTWVDATTPASGFKVTVPGMGGALLVVSPEGIEATQCVAV